PPEQRKIQRDAMRYETGIEFPAKEKPKQDIDFDRLKSRIENKVVPFLIKNEIEGNRASLYQTN
ncbi:MAG: hypothetical protein OEW70_06535, partial [candidate division WOR-3 bacterium]|nr:hypothetical protein [candidate division WOR-3 bacterium]